MTEVKKFFIKFNFYLILFVIVSSLFGGTIMVLVAGVAGPYESKESLEEAQSLLRLALKCFGLGTILMFTIYITSQFKKLEEV